MVVNYQNEPGIDFTDSKNVESFKEALKKVKGELNQKIPLVINGEEIVGFDKPRIGQLLNK